MREMQDNAARSKEEHFLTRFKNNIPRQQEKNHESPYIVELRPWKQEADAQAFLHAMKKVMNRVSRSKE